jgi:DNA-binding winged helix-turn-helix (wHTH) protein
VVPGANTPRQIVHFGIFEVDLRAAELRRNGLKVRLQEQPFQILRMLLERPGDVVLREELQRQLWQSDTVVEFDHSINAAVKRLRQALGEDADAPRYVETLPRRGYRFIAPLNDSSLNGPSALPSPKQLDTQSDRVNVRRAWALVGGLAALGMGFLLARFAAPRDTGDRGGA